MTIGDLVRNLHSERGLLGIIVGWHNITPEAQELERASKHPIVAWTDGRVSWIQTHRVGVVA